MFEDFSTFRNLIINHTNYVEPLSYDDWNNKPNDQKAALLFVQFYEQITLAWYKCKLDYIPEPDALETEMQYLEKNVPIISENCNKFNPRYIYTISKNCLSCLGDVKKEQLRAKDLSNEFTTNDGQTLSLYDESIDIDNFKDLDDVLLYNQFWEEIESCDLETLKVIEHLMNGTSLSKARKNATLRDKDRLADIEVSSKKAEEIMSYLKDKFRKYKELIIPSKSSSDSDYVSEEYIQMLRDTLNSELDEYYSLTEPDDVLSEEDTLQLLSEISEAIHEYTSLAS